MLSTEALIEAIPGLLRYARRLTRHEDNAKDLLQSSLERAWKNREGFIEGDPMDWLSLIMKRLHWNATRDAANKPYMVSYDEPYITDEGVSMGKDLRDHRATPEECLQVAEMIRSVESLKPIHREIIQMLMQEIEQTVMQQLLVVPLGTVKSRVFNARRSLLEAMQS